MRSGEFTLSSSIGVARTLLASGLLLTLLVDDPEMFFRPLKGAELFAFQLQPNEPSWWSLFNLAGPALGRWLAVVLLLLVMSGWRPRITGILHWWVAFSFVQSSVFQEGGDQVHANLSLLLIPVCLVDPRRWHWQRSRLVSPNQVAAARLSFWGVRLQVFAIYLDAAVAKVGVIEWTNGTALYYWLTNPMFGAPDWLGFLREAMTVSVVVVASTWLILVFEFYLTLLLLSRRSLWISGLFIIGGFHLGIALIHGLVSFGIVMLAAGCLYCLRWDEWCIREEMKNVQAHLRRFTGSLGRSRNTSLVAEGAP